MMEGYIGMSDRENKHHAFNNKIETGLRIIAILYASFPDSLDLQELLYLDYLTVHSGDYDIKNKSLHPDNPFRKGEIFVRRSIITEGVKFFIAKGLVLQNFNPTGVKYSASENASPFIENLNEEYFLALKKKAQLLIKKINMIGNKQFKAEMESFIMNLDNNFIPKLIS